MVDRVRHGRPPSLHDESPVGSYRFLRRGNVLLSDVTVRVNVTMP